MKGERRHELEHNELADWLAKIVETTRPYQTAILGGVLLVTIATAGYLWWSRQSAETNAAAWDRFYRAQGSQDPADFEAVVDDYPDTDAARWARVIAGDLRLAMGCNALFFNKADAKQQLREAVDHYRTVLEDDDSGSMLRERATFGLARARESQGDLEKAMQQYEQLSKNWPDGAYAATAAQRLEDLKRPATRQLYDRFAQFDPKPAYPDEPGTPGERPPFDLESLPDDGPVFQPKLLDLREKGVEGGTPEDMPETPAKKPEATDTKPTDTEPAGTKPTDTKPTDTEPADTKPTDTEPTGTKPTDTKPTDTKPTDTEPTGTEPSAPEPTGTESTDTEAPESADSPKGPADQGE